MKAKAYDKDKFLSYLDSLPEDYRPLYGVWGVKAGTWHNMGGGTQQMIALIFRDRVAFSTHGLIGRKQTGRLERALGDLADIRVRKGPLYSSVEFKFRDNSKKKLANVQNKSAAPLAQFMTEGFSAFDRSRLDVDATSDFYLACLKGLPLPSDVFEEEVAQQAIVCPSCGASNKAATKFCTQCGTAMKR